MKNIFRAKKIPDDYHTLDRAGQVTTDSIHTGTESWIIIIGKCYNQHIYKFLTSGN